MHTVFKILMGAGTPSDADLAERELRKRALQFTLLRVDTREEFLAALTDFRPDVILCHDRLPRLETTTALRLALEHVPSVPFIVITRLADEESAVECIKAGAWNYVFSEHLTRLGVAVLGVLEQRRMREEKKKYEDAFRETLQRYKFLAENAIDLIYRYRLVPTRGFEYVSPAALRLTGYRPEDFYADPEFMTTIVPPGYRRNLKEVVKGLRAFQNPLVQRWRRKDGAYIWMEHNTVAVTGPGREIIALEGIVRDVTEHVETQMRLRRSEEMLRKHYAHLQEAREEERTLVAREIHDELGQALTALKMDLAWVHAGRPREVLEAKRASMLATVDGAIGAVQRISAELRPAILDDLGLEAAIEWQVGQFQERSGVPCGMSICHDPEALDKQRRTAVFRILQEALTNISRHAEAKSVRVTLEDAGDSVTLTVADDGKGIPEEALTSGSAFGLIGMRERAQAFGGAVEISGVQGGGTVITARIPGATGERDDPSPDSR